MAEPVVLPNDRYLSRVFIENYINDFIVPALPFMQAMPRIKTDAETITGTKESYGLYDSPVAGKPKALMPGTQFKDIEITALEQVHAAIAGRGFQIKIRDRARIYAAGIDEIARAYQAIIYFATRDMSEEMGLALKTGVRQATTGDRFYDRVHASGYKTWGEDGKTPLEDLIAFKSTLRYYDKPYLMTDAFVSRNNFDEILEYMVFLETSTDKQKASFWQEQDATIRTITMPVIGLRVHELLDGISDGEILGLDANMPPCTMYYTENPLYPQQVKKQYGLHVYTNDDRENGWYLIKLWFETAFLTKAQSAGYFASGI